MEESTPIFDALWEKYNATPIFDQVLRNHEHKKYRSIIREYISQETLKEFYEVWEVRALFGMHPEITKPPTKEKLMNSWQEQVNDFRKAMDLPTPEWPRQLSGDEAEMHIKMIRDEFEKEFVPAARDNDLVAFYDAGIDVIVYVIGALSNAGMDIDPGFIEIMRANMSKLDPATGKAIRSRGEEFDGEPAGKVLKGPAYDPPKLGVILNEMSRYGFEEKRVYKNLALPLTLGIGGPQIGEGTLNVDHNGNLMFEGQMQGVSILPILDHLGLTVSGLSMGPDEPVGGSEDVEQTVLDTFDGRQIGTYQGQAFTADGVPTESSAAPYDR